jgi:hypothetical protein
VAVVDVLGRELGRGLQGAQGVFHAVVLFEARLQPLEMLPVGLCILSWRHMWALWAMVQAGRCGPWLNLTLL